MSTDSTTNDTFAAFTNGPSAQQAEPVAIIGIGCRFPGGATSPRSFWDLLCAGTDATRQVPADRWSVEAFYDPDPAKPGKARVERGGFLDKIDRFDASFFGISPREAASLDPQQRLLMEVAWEAMEDAGLQPSKLAGSQTGVFMGAFTLDYKSLQFGGHARDLIQAHTATGSVMTMVANRLSYIFDLHGPSVAIDTACSSSLVAVHFACRSLASGESELALAGGVNVMIDPDFTIAESKGGFLAPDGRSKAFSARANGYARGEGAGVVVLKLLRQAIADGDAIYAVIRGTAVNQDGRTNGITVPSGIAQEALMRTAYARAGVPPASVQYVEAHGTGTPVGDPIEANAIGTVLATDRPADQPCVIGSVKTNIGHLEAAAGVAGLIKAALCLQNRQIPPHLHFESPNPNIPFEDLRLRVPTAVEEWPSTDGPARAGVNSFGFGGTNAHVVLEEAPEAATKAAHESDERPRVVPLSARSAQALEALAESIGNHAADASVANLAFTLSHHRDQHAHRLAAVATTSDDLRQQLQAFAAGETRPGLAHGRTGLEPPRPVFVFTGMGPQWWAMGRQLLEQEPVFRAAIERCDAALSRHAPWSLLAELTAPEAQSRMEDTEIAQPANFALQVGLAELWRSWGVEPAAIVGHSAGEIAAAYVAGALDWDDAVEVIYHRSRLQQQTTGRGKMLAVGLAADAARDVAAQHTGVSVAAINSPSSVTLVGDAEPLEEIARQLESDGTFARFLRVKVPYHSHYLDPLRQEFVTILSHVQPRAPRIPMYTPVTGARIADEAFDAPFCWRNTRDTVNFADAASALIADGYDTFVELGPHPVLATALMENLTLHGKSGTVVPSLRRGDAERATLLGSLGTLYTLGAAVDWDTVQPGGQRITLPTYPWQGERYWSEASDSESERLGRQVHPLLGQRAESSHLAWELELSTHRLPYLLDHQIQGAALLPGAGYTEMALAAARDAFGEGTFSLSDVQFKRALFLPDGANPMVRVFLDADAARLEIYSRPARSSSTPWALNASMELHAGATAGDARATVDLEALGDRCTRRLSADEAYTALRDRGFEYGPCFRGIRSLAVGDQEAVANIRLPQELGEDDEAYFVHPSILDAAFQSLIACDPRMLDGGSAGVYLPVGIERILVHGRPSGALVAHARMVSQTEALMRGDIVIADEHGSVLVEVLGFTAQALDTAVATEREPRLRNDVYELEWHTQALEGEPALPEQAGTWLVYKDGSGVGDALVGKLERIGERCVVVPSEADLAGLLQQELASHPPLRGVVHLWSLDLPEADGITSESLMAAQTRGAGTVLHLVQALAGAGLQPRVWLATRAAQAVHGDDTVVGFAQAPIWGIGRVMGEQEYLAMRGALVDLDPNDTATAAEQLFGELWTTDGEDQVAYRDGRRYVARLVREAAPRAVLPPHFRADGTYLITGGFGALGQLVARWMVERGARRLILAGRTPVPPRSQWSSAKPGSPTASHIALIRALEAQGASVHIAEVDVADPDELARYLDGYALEAWPPIRGVVHAAGVVRDQILLRMDDENFDTVLRPKVQGAWALHTLLADSPLDFFVLFSSVASIVVSTGQANYASANAFLDALAHYRRARGLPATSINWGPWAVGMIEQLNLAEHYRQRGMDIITPEEGMRLLERLFAQDPSEAVVLAADWPVVFRSYPFIPPLIHHLGDDDATDGAAGSDLEMPIVERLRAAAEDDRPNVLQDYLEEVVARALRLDRSHVDAQQPLSALGMDSMLAIEIKNRVEQTLGVAVSVVDLLQGSSIAALATKLVAQLGPAEDASVQELQELADTIDAAELERMLAEIEAATPSVVA